MGNLLPSPITEKETHRGETDDRLQFAVSSMQGWRVSMEDAHIMQPIVYAEERIDPPQSEQIQVKSGDNNVNQAKQSYPTDDGDKNIDGPQKKAKMTSVPEFSSSSISSGTCSTTSIDNAKVTNENNTSDSHLTNTSSSSDKDTASTTSISSTTLSSSNTTVNSSSSSSTQYRKIQLPNHSLFAVFDGHGGSFAAEYAGQNFCRVLFRQPAFLQYAKYYHEQLQRDERQQQAADIASLNQEKVGEDDSPDEQTNTDGGDVLTASQQAQIHRQGLESIEAALRNAFIELDKEIFIQVTEYANSLYNTTAASTSHDSNQSNQGQQQQQQENSKQAEGEEEENPLTPGEDEDSGTTAIVVLITPQWIICANAGDSRSVYSKNRSMIPLSYDHKPDDEAEERRIQDAGGFVRAGRVEGDLAVSRGLGDFRFKEADSVLGGLGTISTTMNNSFLETRHGSRVAMYGRQQGIANVNSPEYQKVSSVPDIIVQNRNRELDEFITIACDGIWDVQTNHECAKMISDIFEEGESDIGLLCEEILDTCLIKKSKDNMTAMVIKMAAQTIGEGGGVIQRRRLREEELQANDHEEEEEAYYT